MDLVSVVCQVCDGLNGATFENVHVNFPLVNVILEIQKYAFVSHNNDKTCEILSAAVRRLMVMFFRDVN